MGKKSRMKQQRRIEEKGIRVYSGPNREPNVATAVESTPQEGESCLNTPREVESCLNTPRKAESCLNTPREAESCLNSLLQHASLNQVVSQMDLEKPNGRCVVCGKQPASKILQNPYLTGTFKSCGSEACECAIKMLYNDVNQRYHTSDDQLSFLNWKTFDNVVEENGEILDVEVEEMLRKIEITDSTSVGTQKQNTESVRSNGKPKNLTIDPLSILSIAKNMTAAVQAVKK